MKPADPIREMPGQLPGVFIDLIANALPVLIGTGALVVLLVLTMRQIRGLGRD